VDARAGGAHGVFTAYSNAKNLTRAAVLAEKGLETPVFVRRLDDVGRRWQ
jgi:catalase